MQKLRLLAILLAVVLLKPLAAGAQPRPAGSPPLPCIMSDRGFCKLCRFEGPKDYVKAWPDPSNRYPDFLPGYSNFICPGMQPRSQYQVSVQGLEICGDAGGNVTTQSTGGARRSQTNGIIVSGVDFVDGWQDTSEFKTVATNGCNFQNIKFPVNPGQEPPKNIVEVNDAGQAIFRLRISKCEPRPNLAGTCFLRGGEIYINAISGPRGSAAPSGVGGGGGPGLSVPELRKRVVHIQAWALPGRQRLWNGTGFIISATGHVLTARHVFHPSDDARRDAFRDARIQPVLDQDIYYTALQEVNQVEHPEGTKLREVRVIPGVDMVLAKLPERPGGWPRVVLTRKICPAHRLRVSGFAGGRYWDTREGSLTTADGPNGTLGHDIDTMGGMSGGPVTDSIRGNAVIGVTAGDLAPGHAFFTPFEDVTELPNSVTWIDTGPC